MTLRARLAITAALVAVVVLVLAVTAPLRQTSGDTVAARIGGAVLHCAGTFDLDRIDWIHADSVRGYGQYFLDIDHRGQYTSVFGPAPAVVASIALTGTGDDLDEATLRSRERWGAAALVAIAAALLVIAAAARCSLRRAAATGLVAALSFAGVATLGQGLWQATVALPFVVGALATLAWRERMPRLDVVTPALLVGAVMIRPTIAPLALGVGLAWVATRPSRRTWLVAIAIAAVVAAPFVVWNVLHLNSPLPIGQWRSNVRDEDRVFVVRGVASGIAGLLVSPARGIVWFAPLALVGVWAAIRERRWWLLGGCGAQLVVMSAFYKWHGGLAFGPRLLAELTWVAIWLALGAASMPRVAVTVTTAITVAIGLVGLWRWNSDQWETRRLPETYPTAYWDFADSPIASAISPPAIVTPTHDAPARGLRCTGDTLTSYP